MKSLIDGQVFMGSGEHSLVQIGYLFRQLNAAFTVLSGMQQPPRPCDPVDPDWEGDVACGQAEVKRIADEIYLGLTGDRRTNDESR